MPPPVVNATLQSTIISLLSCVVALFLTPDNPPHIASLIIYSVLATPPNFWWQQFIESKFPGYTVRKVEVDDGGKGVEVEKKLNIQNTCVKVALDQTLAAFVNVTAYIGVTRLLRGVPLDLCWAAVKDVRAKLYALLVTHADHITANVADHACRIQIMASGQCHPAHAGASRT